MDLQLKDKRALVTGSSAGIGAAIAKVLAREGAAVIVHGRNAERAEKVVAEITTEGGKAIAVIGDLTSDEQAALVAEQAVEHLGGIDILVNNAGSYPGDTWLKTTPDMWMETYNTDVVATVRMIRALVPAMKERGWGRVIQISSSSATQPVGNVPNYTAAKAALLNLSVSLIKGELANTGVTVNTVSPGVVVVEALREFFFSMAKERGWGDDWESIMKAAQKEFVYTPTGNYGSPEDIANFVAFLSSPLSGYMNGANFRIDGGSTPTIN